MNNRTQKITNKVLLKSSGNFKKIAQTSAAETAQQEALKRSNKKIALEHIQNNRMDRIGVATNYFLALDPLDQLNVINYWEGRIAKGPLREKAAIEFAGGGASIDQSWYKANDIPEISMKGSFEARINYLNNLAQTIKSSIQQSSGNTPDSAAAKSQGGGGSPKAQGPQQDARSPYDPNVPLGAGPEGQKPAPAPGPTGGGKDDVASKPPPSATGGSGAGGAGGAGAAGAAAATPATPQNTQLPPSGSSASNVRQPNYFFPDGKQASIEGYYGPYAAPNGKKRYFKVVFDKSAKRYSYTGEFEDR
jgi:hypothetical protein